MWFWIIFTVKSFFSKHVHKYFIEKSERKRQKNFAFFLNSDFLLTILITFQ